MVAEFSGEGWDTDDPDDTANTVKTVTKLRDRLRAAASSPRFTSGRDAYDRTGR